MISIDSYIYDVGTDHESFEELVWDVIARTKSSWDNGANVVVFPEYMWLNAIQYKEGGEDYTHTEIAEHFWNGIWTLLQTELSQPGKTVVLGSCPRVVDGKLYNTSPIINEGTVILQDKLALTPWETEYTGGSRIHTFTVKGKKTAVLICLDIEMPELAVLLKEEEVDLILVPSATEGMMGVERIARCASARSVEIGAVVVVSALTGEIVNDDFLGSNIGRSSLYAPSLTGLETTEREHEEDAHRIGTILTSFEVAEVTFEVARHETQTTNPANIKVENIVTVEMKVAA